jgi:hypothetical protein
MKHGGICSKATDTDQEVRMCGTTNVNKLDEINTALARARAEAGDRRREADEIEAGTEAWARDEMQKLPRACHMLVELGRSAGSWLVKDWRQAWKWFSVQAMVLDAAILSAWAAFPDDLKAVIPSGWIKGLAIALLIVGVAGRVVKQGGNHA